MILTYKYRLKDRSARKTLRRHAASVNQVWNYCSAYQRRIQDCYRSGAPKRAWPTRYDLQRLTKGTSKDLGINAKTIQLICLQFTRSRDQQKNYPRYRVSDGPRRSLGWIPFDVQSRQLDGNSITYLGKRYRWFKDRSLPETATGGAFVEDATGKWWVCFSVEMGQISNPGTKSVGIDLGLSKLAVMSDGAKIEPPKAYRRYAAKLAIAQRSRNKRRIRAIHTKISNIRKDSLHKASALIARQNALIAVGNVSPARIARTHLAKSVYDAGWSMFRSLLRYKASRHGAIYLDVDEKFTTQACSCCGIIPDSSPKGIGALGIREWECSECGELHDRDVNAARNILILALSAQRPVEESRAA